MVKVVDCRAKTSGGHSIATIDLLTGWMGMRRNTGSRMNEIHFPYVQTGIWVCQQKCCIFEPLNPENGKCELDVHLFTSPASVWLQLCQLTLWLHSVEVHASTKNSAQCYQMDFSCDFSGWARDYTIQGHAHNKQQLILLHQYPGFIDLQRTFFGTNIELYVILAVGNSSQICREEKWPHG